MFVKWLLLVGLSFSRIEARCAKTKSGQPYPLTIGLLAASDNDHKFQDILKKEMLLTGEVATCFQVPGYLTLLVNDTLMIPQHGWTKIQPGIDKAITTQQIVSGLPTLIIGPFYVNLAMILQRMGVPYLVTDYKGYDWIDMNIVQDTVNWKTVVEMRPSVKAQNLAVLDWFLHRNWKGAMMVMPESAADNQECQDLAEQMLKNSLSVIPYTVEPRDPSFTASIREFLTNALLYRQTQLLVCSPRDARDKLVETVLTQARLFGILQDKEFSFIIVDPSSYLLPISGAGNMYRLGLFSARCELLAFRYMVPNDDDSGFSDDNDAAASDAARVTSYALSKYILFQKTTSDDFSSERFLDALKSVTLLDGRTGHIEFDALGHRSNYSLLLYNHGGEDMYKMLATWNPHYPTGKLRLNVTVHNSSDKGVDGMGIFPNIVKIVVVEERPFVILRNDADGSFYGNDKFEGFSIDLIKRLSSELKFQYRIYLSPGNRYGSNLSDGTWDGMVGEILNGKATLACGAIPITSSREAVIDFSLGVLSTGVNILVKKPQESLTIFQFMMPFSLELWMAIVGATATVSLVFFVMDYCSEDRRFTIRETIWFTIGTLLKRGSDFAPVPVSQRILTAGFLFFVLITVSTYTANMAAFLTTKNFGETIDSFESLDKVESMGVSTVKDSSAMDFLAKGTKDVYVKLWAKVNKSGGLVDDAKGGIDLVIRGTHAFIYDFLINEAAEKVNCGVMTAASPILLQEHGIAMKAGAAFKSVINIALLKMKEEGFMSKLKKKWWDDKRSCDLGSDSTRTGQVQFGLDHTAGVFIVGLFGVGVSAILFLGKKIYFLILRACQRHKRNRDNKRKAKQGNHDNNANDEANKERHQLFEGEVDRTV